MSLTNNVAVRSKMFEVATVALLLLFLIGLLYGILEKDFLPGSGTFALFLLAVSAYFGGLVVNAARLPPLLGMLLVGMLFRNASIIPYHRDISVEWSSTLRDCALAILLLKAGLGLDPVQLPRMKFSVFKLSLLPCLCEAGSSAVLSHHLLGLPWVWSLMLGFILCAVSAAVLVPGVLELDAKQLGTSKGISTLLLASVSVDNIVALTGFFVTFSGITSEEVPSVFTFIKRPLEPFLGLLLGAVVGSITWWLPDRNSSPTSLVFNRTLLLCVGGLSLTFLSKRIRCAGAGALGCVSFAFVAALEWRKNAEQFKIVSFATGCVWAVLECFLFSLIGAQVTFESLRRNFGTGFLILVLGIGVRFVSTALSLSGSKMNFKEKTFISAVWMSKATVQAAVGSHALEYALSRNIKQEIQYGEQVLSVAVLSIVLTAPLGAALIDCLGPRLLNDSAVDETGRLLRVTGTDPAPSDNKP